MATVLQDPPAVLGLAFSKHAGRRIRQRGLRERDVDLVVRCGTEVGRDTIALLDADVEREIASRKHEIQALERLRSCRVVVCDGTIVTCYHARAKAAGRHQPKVSDGGH